MSQWFDPLPRDWWPKITVALVTPWPVEAACMDLRWHATETRFCGGKFPARSTFARRWGWGDKRTRLLLAAPERWQDPRFPMSVVDLRGPSSEGQARARAGDREDEGADAGSAVVGVGAAFDERSSNGPAEFQSEFGSGPEGGQRRMVRGQQLGERGQPGASRGPAGGQSRASRGPHARSYTNTATTTATGTRAESASSPAGESSVRVAQKVWDDEFAVSFGQEYCWVMAGRNSDSSRIQVWLSAVRWSPETSTDAIVRLRAAVRRYFVAVKAGAAWPSGEPATTAAFTKQIARWGQEAPGRPQQTASSIRGSGVSAVADLVARGFLTGTGTNFEE